MAPIFAVAGVFVNDGIFKANNLTYPTTVEGFEAVCNTLVAKGIQPFACGAKDKWPALALYMYLTDRYGGTAAFVNAATRKGRFDADPFVKAAQLYQKWVKAGYFGATPLGEAYGDAQQLIATGKAAMHLTGSWMCGTYYSKDFTDQTISFHAFPALKTGGVGPATDIMGMTDIGFIVTKAAKGKEDAVAKFLAVAASPEVVAASGRLSGVPESHRQGRARPAGGRSVRHREERHLLVGPGSAPGRHLSAQRHDPELLPARHGREEGPDCLRGDRRREMGPVKK